MDLLTQFAPSRQRWVKPLSDNQTQDDEQHLVQLEAKLQVVRDRVGGVAKGYDTGLYLHGEGGVGKSFTVLGELRRLASDFVVFNSHMTGRALFDQLAKFPDAVHLLEDMESVFQDKAAQGVLRSALWGQRKEGTIGPLPRRVTWTTHTMDAEFTFFGGIIIVGNRPIDDVPELRAVKTRIACLHLEVTAPEIRARMRAIANQGYDHAGLRLEPAACREVCDYVIEQSSSLRRPLDVRLLINSFNDRVQWEAGDAACHWQDLVTARLHERPMASADRMDRESREERKQRERAIVAEILARTQDRQEQLRLWSEQTGKSQAAWYRRRTEIDSR
ncbi:MAG: hypothetical protein JNM56_28870 [Planctomycetia bacterium]|nr:hypothetical protein [Planctomycetia bacterium]